MQSSSSDTASTGSSAPSSDAGEHALGELEVLRERERQMVELLGSHSPDRLMHDLRNVLNELQLLRAVIEGDEKR
jgi:hypothetical protein